MTNSARILHRSLPVVQAVADYLAARPDVTRLRIEGHSDDTGGRRYNLDLSARRAQQVARELVKLGVAPERLEAVGYGRTHLWVRGETEQARRANRRVEFKIVAREGDPPTAEAPVDAPAPEAPPEPPASAEGAQP